MSKILTVIRELKNLRSLKPASLTDVLASECALGLDFAEEYKEYVLAYGVITAKRVDITGVSEFPRLNVVEVTRKDREANPDLPDNMYVIENTGLDGLIITQDETGAVYAVTAGQAPKKIFDSLADYLTDRQKDM